MNIGWAQGTLLFIIVIEFAIHCQKSGEPRLAYSPVRYVLDTAILLGLLYWGGFFS